MRVCDAIHFVSNKKIAEKTILTVNLIFFKLTVFIFCKILTEHILYI